MVYLLGSQATQAAQEIAIFFFCSNVSWGGPQFGLLMGSSVHP